MSGGTRSGGQALRTPDTLASMTATANPALAAWLSTRSSESPRDDHHASVHLSSEAIQRANRDLDHKELELQYLAEELAQRYLIDKQTRQKVRDAEVRLPFKTFDKPEEAKSRAAFACTLTLGRLRLLPT